MERDEAFDVLQWWPKDEVQAMYDAYRTLWPILQSHGQYGLAWTQRRWVTQCAIALNLIESRENDARRAQLTLADHVSDDAA